MVFQYGLKDRLIEWSLRHVPLYFITTIKPVYRGHPRDQKILASISLCEGDPYTVVQFSWSIQSRDFSKLTFIDRQSLYRGDRYSRFYCISNRSNPSFMKNIKRIFLHLHQLKVPISNKNELHKGMIYLWLISANLAGFQQFKKFEVYALSSIWIFCLFV